MAQNYISKISVSDTEHLIEPTLYVAPTLSGSAYSADLNNFTLVTGATIQAKFATTNPINATLNINSTGAKNIYYNNIKIAASQLKAGHVYTLVYDGTQWQVVGDIDTNTQSAYGNISTSGTLDTASVAVVTDADKKVTTANLAVTDPASGGNSAAFTFIDTISQNGQGKIAPTKKAIPMVSKDTAGLAPQGAEVNAQSTSTKFLREDGTWAAPSYTTNTDANVIQSSNAEDKEFPIILKNTNNTTNETAGVKYVGGVTVNPNDRTVTANEFIGSLRVNRLAPIDTKTYDAALYNKTSGENYYQTFATVTPADYNAIWIAHYKITITATGHSDYTEICDVSISGRGNTYYSYKIYNSVVTYSIYQHVYLRSSSASTPHELGYRMQSSYGADTVQKVVKVDLLEQINCTITLLDSLKLYTSSVPSGYAAWSTFNATSNGLQETGDSNDSASYITTNGFKSKAGANKIYRYTLFARTSDGTYESFVMEDNTVGTTKTANPHGFVPDGKIYWNANNTVYNEGTINFTAYEQYHVVDYRYSFNITNTFLPDYCETYVVYTYNQDDGLLYLDTTQWLASALPISADGKIYQRIGSKYYTGTSNYYQGSLLLNNPYYEYRDGKIRSWSATNLTSITGADDLKAIEAINDNSGLLKKTAANTWTLDTNNYVTSSGITSVTIGATSPVQSSTSTAQTGSSASTTISLANAYGDTKNPYGAKAKNLVLAGPSTGNDAVPSFRALVAADIPDLSGTYAPLSSPAFTDTPTAPTATNGTNTDQIATTKFVNNTLSYVNAMRFKGTLGTGGTITALPASHEAGDTYRVITAGTYAGKYCEVGTLIICVADGTAAADADWTSVETNEDGTIIGSTPSSSTDNAIVRWDGNTGRIIQDSKVTIDDNGCITLTHIAGSSKELNIKYGSTIDYWWGVGTANENHGLYDVKANKWILSAGANNTWSFDGNAATATTAVNVDKLTGFASRAASFTWGNQIGTAITVLNDSTGGSIGFRSDNPAAGQMSMSIDGTIYIKEGNVNISDAIKSFSVSGQTVSYTNLWGTTNTFTTQDTKNTAGSTNSTSKLYLIGATSQATNPTTNSHQYTYVTDGTLSTNKLGINVAGTEKVRMEYNFTDQSLDFIFI